jgi:outer membrane protein TolC
VLSSKTGVATRQGDLISARAAVATASDRLKQLMNMRDGEMFSRLLVVPVDRPNISEELNFDPAAYEASLEESIATALENRPELDIAAIQLENAKLDEYRTRRDMMPQFDLNGTYGQGGRDHKVSQTIYGIRDKEQITYSVGFEAVVPLGNRAARGQYERSRLQRRQAEIQTDRSRVDIMAMVQLAARNVLTNKTLVEANEQAVRLKQAEVAAEESRLRLGVTTSWQVLQVQEQLALAETALLQARIAYEKSLIDLQTAEGTLLDKLEISVSPAANEEGQVGYFESIRPRWN